jgi:hypothetical protein
LPPTSSTLRTKPILFFFFRYRKNPFQEAHEKAQNPKSQNRASHPDNDHRNAKGPIVHISIPPTLNVPNTSNLKPRLLYHPEKGISIKK